MHWLSALVRHVLDGADVVLGTVRPGPGLPSDDADAWYAAHDLGAEHLHIHGANIALTAEAYRQLGGWRPMSTHEDVALAVAARRSGPAGGRGGRRAGADQQQARGPCPGRILELSAGPRQQPQ